MSNNNHPFSSNKTPFSIQLMRNYLNHPEKNRSNDPKAHRYGKSYESLPTAAELTEHKDRYNFLNSRSRKRNGHNLYYNNRSENEDTRKNRLHQNSSVRRKNFTGRPLKRERWTKNKMERNSKRRREMFGNEKSNSTVSVNHSSKNTYVETAQGSNGRLSNGRLSNGRLSNKSSYYSTKSR